MWYILQIAIIVTLVYFYKSVLEVPESIGHIFLFSTLVAFAVTWLISRAIDLVRTNGAPCLLIALLITVTLTIWLIDDAHPHDTSGFAALFATMAVIGLCIFVPSVWVVSRSILLVRRLQGYPPPPRTIRPPITVTLAALLERWRVPLSYCIWYLLFVLFLSLTLHAFDLWGDDIRTYLGQGWGGGLFVFSLFLDIIGPAIATRAIIQWLIQWLLRAAEGSGAPEPSAPQAALHPLALAAAVPANAGLVDAFPSTGSVYDTLRNGKRAIFQAT